MSGTTYSSRLRLTLQGQGENSNTWGIINNLNLGTLLEQAIAGVGAVTVPDSATPYTLTAIDGTADEARNAALVLSGSLSAQRTVIVPTAQKLYLVRNATTGGFGVQVRTASGAGVVVGAGLVTPVYCDGTNVVLAGAQFDPATSTVQGNVSGTAAGNVAKAGDTMTGDLSISKASPVLALNRPAAGTVAALRGRVGGLDRWTVEPGNGTAEGGANAGSDFAIARFSDAGAYIDSPLLVSRATGVATFNAIPVGPASNPTTDDQLARKAYVDAQRDTRVAKAGDTMTGDLAISKAGPQLVLDKAASGQAAALAGRTGASQRWFMELGNANAEAGSNAGSDFSLTRYSDAGAVIDSPFVVTRSTGVASFSAIPTGPASDPTTGNQLARKAYVDTKAASGAITGSGLTMATARLLGRTTAATGAVEEVSVGSGLTLSGGALTATGGIDRQVFSAAGANTWTKPAGFAATALVLLEAWGAGGSGGRNNGYPFGAGGGGGAYTTRWVALSDLGSTETITIGAGGASRTGSNQAGAAGGNTTIGSLLTAYGGGGGGIAGATPFGGAGGLFSAGGTGTNGGGGFSPFVGGQGGYTDPGAPADYVAGEAAYGGGGGGGYVFTTGGRSAFGGAGGNAGATGAAGAQPGGGGGAGTTTSGAGGAGRVIITVFR